MSQGYEWDTEDDEDFDEVPNQAPPVPAELRKAHRTLKKQNKELMEELQALKSRERERSVREVLTSRNLNPKIAAFIPAEITDPDAVAQWVEQYADVFGGPQPDAQDGQEQQPVEVPPELAALNRISQTQSTGTPLKNDPEQILARINSAQTPEELNLILFGNPNGPEAY